MRFWSRVEIERDARRVLVPASAHDVDLLAKVRTDVILGTYLRYRRNDRRERWYWGFVQHVADGLGRDRYSLHAELKFLADRVEAIIEGQYGPVVLLQSTSREAMDDARFAEYVNQAVEITFNRFLPDVRRKDIIAEINRMVGFDRPL